MLLLAGILLIHLVLFTEAGELQALALLTDAPEVVTVDRVGASETERLLSWQPGRCVERFRVWRWSWDRWRWEVFAVTKDTMMIIPVKPTTSSGWRVSAICPDGVEWV